MYIGSSNNGFFSQYPINSKTKQHNPSNLQIDTLFKSQNTQHSSNPLILNDEQKSIVNIILKPHSSTSNTNKEKSASNNHDIIRELCTSRGIIIRSKVNRSRVLLLKQITRCVHNKPSLEPISQSDILGVILVALGIPTENKEKLKLKREIVSFLATIKNVDNTIKSSRNIEDKINIALDLAASATWNTDPRKRELNRAGICQLNTFNHMAYKMSKDSSNKQLLGEDLSSSISNKYKSVKKWTFTRPSNYSEQVYNTQIKLSNIIKPTAQLVVDKNQFSAAIKHLIQTKFPNNEWDVNQLRGVPSLYIDVILPNANINEQGHSIYLGITQQKLNGKIFYKLECYDSNYGTLFSHSRHLLIKANDLNNEEFQIKWPFTNHSIQQVLLETYEKSPISTFKLNQNKDTLATTYCCNTKVHPFFLSKIPFTTDNPPIEKKELDNPVTAGITPIEILAASCHPQGQLYAIKNLTRDRIRKINNFSGYTLAQTIIISANDNKDQAYQSMTNQNQSTRNQIKLNFLNKIEELQCLNHLWELDQNGTHLIISISQGADFAVKKKILDIIERNNLKTKLNLKNKNGWTLAHYMVYTQLDDERYKGVGGSIFDHYKNYLITILDQTDTRVTQGELKRIEQNTYNNLLKNQYSQEYALQNFVKHVQPCFTV